jgi:peptide/nickel transport system substrate-binding protein
MRVKAVGTGPFKISDIDEGISMILKRHNRYHGVDTFGNKLPFLDAISIQFLKDKKTELFEFKKGNLDMLYRLPTEYIIEVLEDINNLSNKNGEYTQYELQRAPEMLTQFLSFNTYEGIFKNKNVRKAFSFAIDRDKILEYILNGEGYAAGNHGITPPSFSNYDIAKIKGYSLNIDSARYYLAKAGYPDAKGFPPITLQLNAEGERNTNVAVEVQKQLKDNLNITINLNVLPMAQAIENNLSGNFTISRNGWQADFPSAENFLWLFYGKDVQVSSKDKSYPNFMRYKNETFDQLYVSGLNAKSVEEGNQYFLQAEQAMMNDAPIIVLWYDEGYRLIQSYVKNFSNNPMQYRDLSQVYLGQDKDSYKDL